MNNLIIIILVIFVSVHFFAQAPRIQWQREFGGVDFDKAYSVVQASDGGFIVVGHTKSFGHIGRKDVFLLKLNANGDSIWTKIYGGLNADIGFDIAKTSDNGYIITGTTASVGLGVYDVFLQ